MVIFTNTFNLQDDLFASAARFIILKNIGVSHVNATSPGAFFEDNVMKIEYVPIIPAIIAGNDRSDSDSPVGEEDTTNYYSNRQNTASPNSFGNVK